MKKPALFENLQAHVLPIFQRSKKHGARISPQFKPGFLKAGDLVIHYENGAAGHMLIVDKEGRRLIDSRFPVGVGYNDEFPFNYEIYRLRRGSVGHEGIAMSAAYLANNWIGKVKYADKVGIMPIRQVLAGAGTSCFGKGAQARLLKYGGEAHSGRPKNAICSELCILAYQLSTEDEKSHGFIRLDAKYATPPIVRDYLRKNSKEWELVDERL